MASIVNVYFKVIRIDNNKNYKDPFSRLFLLESVDLEATFDSHLSELCSSNLCQLNSLLVNIKRAFPELQPKEKQSEYCILVSPDIDGDNILIETVMDLHAIIRLNKKKCFANEAIPLYIKDPTSKRTSVMIVYPKDSEPIASPATAAFPKEEMKRDGHIQRPRSTGPSPPRDKGFSGYKPVAHDGNSTLRTRGYYRTQKPHFFSFCTLS